jgi:hypothetical protein
MQMKIAALEGAWEKLKGSVSESKDLVKKEKEEILAEEGKAIIKEMVDLQPTLIRCSQRAAIITEAMENNRRSKPVKHYRGPVQCQILDPSLKHLYAYHPPAQTRKGERYNEPVDLMFEGPRTEDKKVFVDMQVNAAIDLEREGKLKIVGDINSVECEIENRLSPLPPIFDLLTSLKLYFISGNGLSPDLQEFVEKGIVFTIFDAGRLMNGKEKESYLKKLTEEA